MEKAQVIPHIELAETPTTVRYMLSDGRMVDVTGHHANSTQVGQAILDATGDKTLKIVGWAVLQLGTRGGAITIASWGSESEDSERKRSSNTSRASSKTTKRRP